MRTGRPPVPAVDRFTAKYSIDPTTGCWVWLANTSKDGYGKFKIKDKTIRAHRASYELFVCDPGKAQVLHRCDNRLCVNPKHLFLGTHQDNMDDMVSKKRQARLDTHGRALLTKEDVRAIHLLNRQGISYDKLAKKYSVHKSTVALIVQGKHWVDIYREFHVGS
jgi:hypothetical protein